LVNLDILNNLANVESEGKINLFALKYVHKSKNGNFVVSLPSNQSSYFRELYCRFLSFFKNFDCCRFDPVEKKDNTYEFMPLDRISKVWNAIVAMINESVDLRNSSNRNLLPFVNLTICELVYKGKTLWLGTQQRKTESLFKGKHPFFATEDKLELLSLDKLLALSFNVDFIVDFEDSAVVYIFNREKFVEIFNFYDLLKEYVQTKSDVIKKWAFLDNPKYIQNQVGTGYVFKGLSRIIDDTEYLKIIETTSPSELKKRLIDKCPNLFSTKDFEGDKLKVTRTNLKNVIKMVSKGFRYNFFADRAEDLK